MDVEDVCDTVAVVVEPGSGDTLQFLKAGILEVPEILVVTKADRRRGGAPSPRPRPGAGLARLVLRAGRGGLSAPAVTGIDELAAAPDAPRARIDVPASHATARPAADGARGLRRGAR